MANETEPVASETASFGEGCKITLLPIEILLDIFIRISGKEIVNLLSTCHGLRRFLPNESIWWELCSRYGVHELANFRYHDPNRTFFTVYTELLHTYGPLLGLWASNNPFQGAIFEFRVISAGEALELGCEGILGEAWNFDSDVGEDDDTEDERDDDYFKLPKYFSSICIELLPPPGPNEPKPSRLTKFFWLTCDDTDDTLIREKSTTQAPVRLLSQFGSDYFLFQGHPSSDLSLVSSRSSLHPRLPGSLPSGLWDEPNLRLPLLVPHQESEPDHRSYIAGLPIEHSYHILYAVPSSDTNYGLTPIQIVPPPQASQQVLDFFTYLHNPPERADGILDARLAGQALAMSPDQGRHRCEATNSRFFPMRPLSSLRPPPSLYVEPKEVGWSPHSVTGLWLGPYSLHGTEVLYVHFDEAEGQIQAWKVTGDCNVPRGAMSWVVYTNKVVDNPELDDLRLRGEHPSRYKLFGGVATVADEGFGEGSREHVRILAAITGKNEFRICWRFWEDEDDAVFNRLKFYARYRGRDISAEKSPKLGIRLHVGHHEG